MMNFKEGDRVKVKPSAAKSVYYSTVKIGEPAVIDKVLLGKYRNRVKSQATGLTEVFQDEDLEIMERTLDNLQTGDIITRGVGEYEVLGVLANVIFLSEMDNFDVVDDYRTVVELQDCGWKLKQDQPTEDTVELTLEDVAKLKGVDVSKIKIVEK